MVIVIHFTLLMVMAVMVGVFFSGRAAAHQKQSRKQERKNRFHSAGTVGAEGRYFKLISCARRNCLDGEFFGKKALWVLPAISLIKEFIFN
ncbi:MAG: hypothetical protein QGG00_01135 [Verrucomicrobiota bacterium]|nr:hypothetical protein [Verrucomicrobiota bacterium]